MTRHGIDLDSASIRAFCSKWKIRELSVFGSILRDDFRPDSDIDFLADFAPEADWDLSDHVDMEEELAALLRRRVDVLRRSVVEQCRNRFYRRGILHTVEPVIAAR